MVIRIIIFQQRNQHFIIRKLSNKPLMIVEIEAAASQIIKKASSIDITSLGKLICYMKMVAITFSRGAKTIKTYNIQRKSSLQLFKCQILTLKIP
jgi:hypothetical protein